jgi:polyphosphate kinase 2 (PPK2 family)
MKKILKLNQRILNLSELDLSLSLNSEIYKEQMKFYKSKLRELTFLAKVLGRPIVLVFEGWDAAGKGGAIRRLTQEMDPRLFEVHNIAAPSADEKKHHYLWRFWNRIPSKGHLGIFDRSWYGRVLVERIEGFAEESEWMRAYEEISLFEEQLVSFGTIILKFWIHISKEEQNLRFEGRKNDPLRRWKLTEEDFRNREKWSLYEEAANDMFQKTDVPLAPWILIPGNDKYYARLTVLKSTVQYLQTLLQTTNI